MKQRQLFNDKYYNAATFHICLHTYTLWTICWSINETTKWQFRYKKNRQSPKQNGLPSYFSDIIAAFREQLTLVISFHHLLCFILQTFAVELFTQGAG